MKRQAVCDICKTAWLPKRKHSLLCPKCGSARIYTEPIPPERCYLRNGRWIVETPNNPQKVGE